MAATGNTVGYLLLTNNLQEGFTVNERLPDTLVDVAVWHVFNRAPQLYRQAPQIKKPPCVTLVEVTGRAKIVY